MCCNEDPMQQPSQKKTLSRKNTAYRIQNIFANHVSGKALVSRIYVLCLVAQSCPTLWGPMDWSGLPRPPPGDLPNPGTEPRSPTLQVDSLPAEPPGKPKNTGVSSLSLLQRTHPDPGIEPGSPELQWLTQGEAKGAENEESDEPWAQGVWGTWLAPMFESLLEKQ